MNTKTFNARARLTGSALLAMAVASALHAQEQPAAQQQDDADQTSGLETIVVTGTAIAGGVKKLEASYNIVTANEEEIRRANPKSTADLLKISPGMWPESSGGQTGANIEIAGFPGGGDAPYFTTQLMGSPLYGMPTLSFFETTSIFRLDDTVRSAEVLQGGPSVVFAGGQMGATANFLLKTGSETPKGSLGITYGDENLMRIDGFYGFPVGGDWYGSVGGFWRKSDGVRDPQFAADEGGQLTGTLKHETDKSKLTLYARYLDDKNQFITPIPLIQRGTDDFSAYPGFDPQTSTYYSNAIRKVRLDGYPGGGTNADLANGRGAKMAFLGANYDLDFDNGWSIADKFLWNAGDVDTNALFSGTNPATLDEELYTVDSGLGGFELPAGSATAEFVGGGAVPGTQSVIHQGWWFIHKKLENINNDFRLSKELFEGNTLTIGLYTAYYTMDDKWALGNQMLMTNEPNARPITVSYEDGGTFQLTDGQGFLDNGAFNITEKGHAFNKALYLSDSWRVDKWLLDASVRYENQDATNRVCNLTNQDTDGNPNTLYNNNVPVCNGTFSVTDYDENFMSWTVGANYSFTDSMSAYVRVNRGGHFLDFDNGIRGNTTGNTPPIQVVRNYEVGWKFQNPLIYADISAYFRDFSGLLYTPTDDSGVSIPGAQLQYGSESKGVNVIGAITPGEHFRFQVVANYLDGEYTDYDACVPYSNVVTGPGCAVIQGKQLQRQPKLRYMLTPSYKWSMGDNADIEAFVTYTHVGDHTQDQSALQQLGSYYTWDFGVTANVGNNWQFSLRGTNVTDELGLTESNSRIFGVASDAGGVLLARPIEGSEINFQAKYLF